MIFEGIIKIDDAKLSHPGKGMQQFNKTLLCAQESDEERVNRNVEAFVQFCTLREITYMTDVDFDKLIGR